RQGQGGSQSVRWKVTLLEPTTQGPPDDERDTGAPAPETRGEMSLLWSALSPGGPSGGGSCHPQKLGRRRGAGKQGGTPSALPRQETCETGLSGYRYQRPYTEELNEGKLSRSVSEQQEGERSPS